MTIRLSTPLSAHFPDLCEVLHIFFPEAKIEPAEPDTADFLHGHQEADGWAEDQCAYQGRTFRWTTRIEGDAWELKRRRKRGLKQCCYYLLRALTGIEPPWGSLTGIRPTRLFYNRLSRGDKPEAAREALIRLYDLSEDRAQLLLDTCMAQRGLIDAPDNAVDVYVGIPFCTSRCGYCSFFAETVGDGRKVPPYLVALFMEMEAMADLIARQGLMVRALYVGGGTPTALSTEQLYSLLSNMRRLFPTCREWTVEAGRPDTIDREKLRLLKESGVTRVCINPQTMNDETLKAVGRAHSAKDARRAFHEAREAGFDNINMDLIAALPGEDQRAFAHTLDAIHAMGPDSLTVHTLARKHGSRLNEFGFEPTEGRVAEEMVEMGAALAHRMGMRPYYLYRQKYVAGNLENVAYASPGKECLYNIDIMEETVPVLALGAGAISKRIFPRETRIERAPNAGDIGVYINRVAEMIDRKTKLWEC